MPANLNREIGKLKKSILTLGALVEHRFKKAVNAIQTGDQKIAQFIIDSDIEIDDLEVEIEEDCLKILALYQPVATDLRTIVAVIKINNDLERVGDQAVNIAHRVQSISGKNLGKFVFDYTRMADITSTMLKRSLDALVNLDIETAQTVRDSDLMVNAICKEAYDTMKISIQASPENAGRVVNRYLISRHLERVGDHACNIAEEVIHLAQGKIVRHNIDLYENPRC